MEVSPHPPSIPIGASTTLPPWMALNSFWLLFGTLFIHNPSAIYSGSPDEFNFNLKQIILILGAAGIIATTVGSLLLWILPRSWRNGYIGISTIAALIIWVNSSLLLPRNALLTGERLELSPHLGDWALDVLLLSTLVTMGLIFGKHFISRAALFILVLNFGLTSLSVVSLMRDSHNRPTPFDADLADPVESYRFSSKGKNVIAVLLDGLQGDVFWEVVQNDPDLLQAFDGFTFYRNGMGVARTTYLSLPAIWSGRTLGEDLEISEYRHRSRVDSFYRKFIDAGIDVAMIKGAQRCPKGAVCSSTKIVHGGPWVQLSAQAFSVLDISLLRAAPRFAKSTVYNSGQWILRGIMRDETTLSTSIRDNAYLRHFAENIYLDESGDTFKFLYLFNTHAPTDISEECRYLPLEQNRESYKFQSQCALNALSEVFNKLKRVGIYDNTAILLLSDHGMPWWMPSAFTEESAEPSWKNLVGSANPALALKPFRAEGSLQSSDAPVQLTDVGATLCRLFDACSEMPGTPFQDAEEGTSIRRKFLYYPWGAKESASLSFENIEYYVVEGSMYEPQNWTLEKTVNTIPGRPNQ